MASSETGNNKVRSKSKEKRQQILNAASNLFLTHGFENTSMDQVAIDAGVSKQTVYSHFGNKEDLFTAIIEYKCIAHELTDKLFDIDQPVSDLLYELAQHYSDLILSEDAICIKRVCVAETPQRTKVAKLYWTAGPQRLTERLTHYLSEQNARGTMHIENPNFAAQQFLYMLSAETHHLKILGQPDGDSLKTLNAYIDSCVKLFIKAYID